MYDLIIIGGGPGGVAAGIYAARKKINTLLIAESFGGQSITSADIQNWIGTKSISGFDLAKNFEEHLRAQESIEIVDGDLVSSVKDVHGGPASPDGGQGGLEITTANGKTFQTKYLLVASGSRRKKLGVPGERELDGRGVVYCSTCDAPLFKDKVVAVVGGGNAGLEAVLDLFPYATKIYLLEYSETFKGDAVTLEKIKANPKVELLTMAETQRVLGSSATLSPGETAADKPFVTGLEYLDHRTNEVKKLDLQGVFIEIGALPNTEFVKDLVQLNKVNEIVADPRTEKTSHPRIWAVGDATDVLYKQNNISAGDAVKAVLNIYDELMRA